MVIIRLVKKAQKGDDKAFLKIFQQHEEQIYRMAFIYVKNESDALDIVQEVAYRSFKKIGTLKNPEFFKTWLIKMTIACSIDLLRKNKKVVQLKSECDDFIGTVEEDFPLSITLQQLLEKLNEDERSIVVLRFYEGYSFIEIADFFNMPIGTIKSRLYRALSKLRREFKEADIYE